MKRNFLVVIFLIMFIFTLYSGEWFFEFEPLIDFQFNYPYLSIEFLGVEAGLLYDDNYYLLFPEHETIMQFSFSFKKKDDYVWNGIISMPETYPESDIELLSFYRSELSFYLKQILSGDRYHEWGAFGIGFKSFHELYIIPESDVVMNRAHTFVRNGISEHNRFAVSLFSNYSNDDFWPISGFANDFDFGYELGVSKDKMWHFLSSYNSLTAWLPIYKRFLYMKFKGKADFLINPFRGDMILPFYVYPTLNLVRGMNYHYRDNMSLAGNVEIRSVFPFDILYPQSLGLILFYDCGVIKDKLVNVKTNDLNMSFGGLVEYKFFFRPFQLKMAMHMGIVYSIVTENDWKAEPNFYMQVYAQSTKDDQINNF